MALAKRMLQSSAIVRAVRSVVEGSVVCTVVRGVTGWLLTFRQRIVAGLGGGWSHEHSVRLTQRTETLLESSRLARVLSWLVDILTTAVRVSWVGNAVDHLNALGDVTKVRIIGVVLMAAVASHALMSAILGVHLQALGWSMRLGLAGAGLLMTWRPNALAAAWKHRYES